MTCFYLEKMILGNEMMNKLKIIVLQRRYKKHAFGNEIKSKLKMAIANV